VPCPANARRIEASPCAVPICVPGGGGATACHCEPVGNDGGAEFELLGNDGGAEPAPPGNDSGAEFGSVVNGGEAGYEGDGGELKAEPAYID